MNGPDTSCLPLPLEHLPTDELEKLQAQQRELFGASVDGEGGVIADVATREITDELEARAPAATEPVSAKVAAGHIKLAREKLGRVVSKKTTIRGSNPDIHLPSSGKMKTPNEHDDYQGDY